MPNAALNKDTDLMRRRKDDVRAISSNARGQQHRPAFRGSANGCIGLEPQVEFMERDFLTGNGGNAVSVVSVVNRGHLSIWIERLEIERFRRLVSARTTRLRRAQLCP